MAVIDDDDGMKIAMERHYATKEYRQLFAGCASALDNLFPSVSRKKSNYSKLPSVMMRMQKMIINCSMQNFICTYALAPTVIQKLSPISPVFSI